MASSTNATTSPLRPPLPPAAADDEARPGGSDGSSYDDGPRLLAFVVAGRPSGCPLADVHEIIPARATTRLPGAPPHVIGLLNLRGTLLTVLDLALALDASGVTALAPCAEDDAGEDPPALTHSRAGAPSAPALPVPPASAASAAPGHILVIDVDGRRVGCRVDAVRRVHPMPALIPSSVVGNVGHQGIVLGVGDAGDTMVAVLDLPALARQTLLFPGER